MVKSTTSVLQQHPSKLLGLKLTSNQQVLYCFVVPAVVSCAIYILDIATNVAVIYRHFLEDNVRWATSTIFIMYVPSVVFFTLTVSNIDLWNKQLEQSTVFRWICVRVLHLVVFPILGLYRYAKLIFWSTDALIRVGNEREESLKNLVRPSRIELYFFLQAYLQGLPQSILQLSILFTVHNDDRETDSMQVFCIATSLMIVSVVTVSFQRFESQRILGRLKPWADLPENEKDTLLTEDKSSQYEDQVNREEQANENLNINSESELGTPYLQPKEISIIESVEERFSSSTHPRNSKILQNSTSSNPHISWEEESPYVDPVTLRINPESVYNYKASPLPPPPPLPPPQPSSPVPFRSRALEFPTRKIALKGLERDDLLGKSVSFLMWFFCVAARIISLITLFQFFPWLGCAISLFHYLMTLLIIHKYFKSISSVLLQVALAYVFSFCLIEWKRKFSKVYLIYTIFFFTMTIENIALSTAWYLFADWEGWWFHYTYSLIWGCQMISLMSVLTYFFILKPKAREFYPDETT